MHHVDASRALQQLNGKMADRGGAERRDVDLARIGLGVSDQLRKRLGWHRRIDFQHQRQLGEARHHRDVAQEVERQRLIERHVDGVGRDREEQRVAVRRRVGDSLRRDIGAAARAVLDHYRLAHPVRQKLRDQAGDDVGRSAGWKRYDKADRPGWIGLRDCNAREGREYDGGACKTQQPAAWKRHGSLLETTARDSIGLYSAAACCFPCGARLRKCGRISCAIAVMFARAISSGRVPNCVLVSDVLKPARSWYSASFSRTVLGLPTMTTPVLTRSSIDEVLPVTLAARTRFIDSILL